MSAASKNNFVIRMKVRDDRGNVVGETEAITFKGLLHLAHEEGLQSVRTELVQVPSENNDRTAVVRATVRTRKGVFTGIGDANATNVNRRIVPHLVRMAETRAVARAFRVAVNVGAVAVEELAEEAVATTTVSTTPVDDNNVNVAPSGPKPALVRARGRDPEPETAATTDRRAMSEEQKKLLFRLAYQLGEARETAASRVLEALGLERFELASRAAAARAIDGLKAHLAEQEQERDAIVQEARHG